MNKDKEFMDKAISVAKEGIKAGQTPFGSVIVKDNKVVVSSHNSVWADTDITAHAEITAIRECCKVLETIDLSDCEIYTTCEPCPMCFSAIHWGRFKRVIYGASIGDAKDVGFNELDICNSDMKKLGDSKVEITPDILKDQCKELFTLWKTTNKSTAY
ncbi:MAG: nucleoside deaminase [Campylobacterota bacterium]|nr:nucleoside deaminase [Campylobacterota bacterium]